MVPPYQGPSPRAGTSIFSSMIVTIMLKMVHSKVYLHAVLQMSHAHETGKQARMVSPKTVPILSIGATSFTSNITLSSPCERNQLY